MGVSLRHGVSRPQSRSIAVSHALLAHVGRRQDPHHHLQSRSPSNALVRAPVPLRRVLSSRLRLQVRAPGVLRALYEVFPLLNCKADPGGVSEGGPGVSKKKDVSSPLKERSSHVSRVHAAPLNQKIQMSEGRVSHPPLAVFSSQTSLAEAKEVCLPFTFYGSDRSNLRRPRGSRSNHRRGSCSGSRRAPTCSCC